MDLKRIKLERLAAWAGIELDDSQVELLEAFEDWLGSEAIPAGGLGPSEGERLWDRHILDSLALSIGFKDRRVDDATDLGTGVGLPGLPLAIAWPGVRWLLVDRSGRRVHLAARAIRVLGLDNVRVERSDLEAAELGDLVVARAVSNAAILVDKLASRFEGVAVIAASRRPASTPVIGEVIDVPSSILDGGAHIHIIDFRDNG